MDKIKELDGIEPHPSHSPDLAPPDYYLFIFKDVEDVNIGVQAFIDSKPKELFSQGLDDGSKLMERMVFLRLFIYILLVFE